VAASQPKKKVPDQVHVGSSANYVGLSVVEYIAEYVGSFAECFGPGLFEEHTEFFPGRYRAVLQKDTVDGLRNSEALVHETCSRAAVSVCSGMCGLF